MAPTPSPLASRWPVIGRVPDTAWKRVTFLDPPSRSTDRLIVHLGKTSTISVTISRSGIEQLSHALRTGNACAVTAEHRVHGERLLCVCPVTEPDEPAWTDRPADAPPFRGRMMLYLILPDDDISIVFEPEQRACLATAFADSLAEEDFVAR